VPLHHTKRPQDAAVTHATPQHTILLEYHLSSNRLTQNRSDLLSLTLCTPGHSAKPDARPINPVLSGTTLVCRGFFHQCHRGPRDLLFKSSWPALLFTCHGQATLPSANSGHNGVAERRGEAAGLLLSLSSQEPCRRSQVRSSHLFDAPLPTVQHDR